MNKTTEILQIGRDIQNICPAHSSFARCINQLRAAKIHFLNLGNIIICPEYNCLFIFRYRLLEKIEYLSSLQT